MANLNAPKGFVPVRHVNGAPWNGAVTPMLCQAADATAIFIGDVVKLNGSSGAAKLVVNGMDCEGMPAVARDTAGTTGQGIAGVVVGFLPDPTTLTTRHRLASTNRVALVVTDPSVVYEVQEDPTSAQLAAADIGLCAAITTTVGNTTTGVSKMTVDANSKATTSTLPLKVLGLSKRNFPGGNQFSTVTTEPAKFEVIFNTGWLALNSVGV